MFFQFSPVRTKSQPKPIQKENESEKIEVLSLAPFTHNPKLFFEDVKIGVAVSRGLSIDNPTSQDIDILVSHNIPHELNVTLNWTETTIPSGKNAMLEVTWCPLKEECARYNITVHGKRIHRDVPVAFKSLLPKKSKTGTKSKRKPLLVVRKQISPVQKTSPTKKYYSSKPPNISPKKYSPSQRKRSPMLKKSSPSPGKKPRIVINGESSPSPKHRVNSYSESPKSRIAYKNTRREMIKENIPVSLLDKSEDSNVFVSPASATFHLDYLQPVERRETYVVGKEKSPDSVFNDSLENISPKLSSRSPDVGHNVHAKLPLGTSNRDNIPVTPATYNFEYKLLQMESFCFTPISTPGKQTDIFSPTLSSTIERQLEKNANLTNPLQIFPEKNKTFEMLPNSPNVSSETYVKSNLSAETYVKGNGSFETYVKGNISGGTYTKDSSVGDVGNLSLSPVPPKPKSPSFAIGVGGDSAKYVIEANQWSGMRSRPLTSIKEESYSISEVDLTQRSFLKRKSSFDMSVTAPKRPNVTSAPKEWSRQGGAAFRVAKKTTGLNLRLFNDNNRTLEGKEATATITKKDTNTIIIQNPFLLAATNLVDPFMTPHLCISEEWLDQQQVDFKKWLNALLTPPEELSLEEQVVDVAKVWQECKKREVETAPSKEEVSSKYHTNNKLNSLRKSAQTLFRSKEMSAALSKVVLAVETGKLAIREDKDIHLNLLLKSEIMSMLLSYNPLWLRIGLETVYNELIPLKSNSDVMGLSAFIATRLLKDPYLLKKHKSVHSPKYISDFKKFFLKKFLVLVYFLDQAKNKKLIAHDPCLFCKKAAVKESKEMLTRLAREMLAAIGDINKYLRHIGYVVTHCQTYIHEFDYAINSLGVDLRDGVRLTKVMEIILLKEDLTSNLRVPAISRLQKVHNMKIVFESLEKAGFKILYDISPKDIVDGHKEKTLSFLWQIIYKFQAPLMVKSATTIQSWYRSLPVTLKRRKLERVRLLRENAARKIQNWYRRQKLSKKLFHFISLLKTYLEARKQEKAALKIQSYYRMCRYRRIYTLQYRTIVNIQKLAKGWLVRNVYRDRIKKAIVIQKNIRKFLARKRFLKLREATNVIQTRYRAKRLMRRDKAAYTEFKTNVTFIQRKFRAKRVAKKTKTAYEKLKCATIFIQQRYRANRLCRIQRKHFLAIKVATVRIQTWYRSLVAMKRCRQEFLALKKSVTIVEERYLALTTMRSAKKSYQVLRRSSMVIQQRYRAYREMKVARKLYLELKTSAVVVQQRYRAKKRMEIEKRQYEALRSSTIVVQRVFRANLAMKEARNGYLKKKAASIKVQSWFRATLQMRTCRTYYVSLKRSVLIFEERYKAKKLMETQKRDYQRLKSAAIVLQRRYRATVAMRQAKTEYITLKSTAIFVQRRFRANKLGKVQRQQYQRLKEAAVLIQNRYRAQMSMRRARKEFLEKKRATLVVQRRFRANASMKTARNYYQTLLKATVVVQQRFRANRAMVWHRESYVKLRHAITVIQQRWRAKKMGEMQRQQFRQLKNATGVIQTRWRALKLGQRERIKYLAFRRVALFVQSKWRAKTLCIREKTRYKQLKKAAVVLQQRWRAKNVGEKKLEEYKMLKQKTVFIQRRWKANKLAKLERAKYEALKIAVGVVQSQWRAKRLGVEGRKTYLELRKAAIVMQKRWRAKKLGEEQLKSYKGLKRAAIWIQRKWRANRLGKLERARYGELKKGVGVVQCRWRARQLGVLERKRYLVLKKAVVVMQRRWRARQLGNRQLKRYRELRKAVMFVQSKWRANKRAKLERRRFCELKEATAVVKAKWIANKMAIRERKSFLELKNAAIVVQRRWRAKQIGSHCLRRYQQLKRGTVFIQRAWRLKKMGEFHRNKYIKLRSAVLCIQRRWMARRLMLLAVKRYTALKSSVRTVQRRYRANLLMRQQRQLYMKIRTSTIVIQRYYRGYLAMKRERSEFEVKRKVVATLQRYVRGYLVRRKYADYFTPAAREQRRIALIEKRAAIKIQSVWRGHRSRSIDTPDLLKIRQRAKKANIQAEPQNTLGSRCRVVLQALVNEKSTVFVINKALEDLDFITRHSKDICTQIAQFLPEQMYLMIKTTNRSLPEMTACLYSVNILINIYKYAPTRASSFVPDYIDNIITVMLHWCDKDAQLFPSMCTLLWLFAHNPKWKRFIKALPNIQQRFSKIESQVLRKNSMVKRTGVKGHSVFASYKTLPLPSCDSDWGLEYKHKPYVFSNSVHAFSSLLSILEM